MSIFCDNKCIFTILLDGLTKKPLLSKRLSKNGGNSMVGPISMANNHVNNVLNSTTVQDAATKTYLDSNIISKVSKSGDTIQGALTMSSNRIIGLGDPTTLQDCVTKTYVDALGIPSFITITGVLPNTPNAEIYLYTAPTVITINNGKMWMQRVPSAGEWFISSAPGFKSLWTYFPLYIRDGSLMFSFTGVPYNINT